MTVKIQKPISAQAQTPKLTDHLKKTGKGKTKNPLTIEQMAKIDELVQIEQALEDAKPMIKKQGVLKTELKSIADELFDPAQTAILIGNVGQVEFSPMTDVRYISDMNGLIGKLKDKLGYEGLIELLKVTLGDVDKYLTPSEASKYLDTKSGSRILKSATRFKD